MRVIELLRGAPDSGAGLRPVRSELTTREWEVLDHLCAGLSTREVAEALVLSEDTVYSHVKNIMRKMHVHSRAEAVQRALEARGQAAGA
jgi:DNA-binding NarL/FixJ family response regulator